MVDTRRLASEVVAHLGAGTDRRVIERSMRAALSIWPVFLVLDAYMCFVAFPAAPFPLFVFYRILVELVFLVVYQASRRDSVATERLFRWLRLSYIIPAFTISLMAIHLGGIRSPYMHGISIVSLVWAALVPTHWRRALPALLGIGLSFPLVMAGGAAVSPTARAEWLDFDALTVFTSNYVFVLASSTLSVILCHMVWSAQQQARSLGSYTLEQLLGRGGMGEVWRARHQLLARQAAIKLIRPEALGSDAEARQTTNSQVRARGAGHRLPPVSSHDPGLRLRRLRYGHLLLRHGAPRGVRPSGPRRTLWAAAGGARGVSARAGVRLAQ